MTAVPTETIALAGLDGEVEILIDRWGIPHIYAESEAGAFFAQGFNAGRDRLWQIDMWRKRGLGLTAGDLGPDFVARDRAARLLVYRGDMAAEWRCYGKDAEAWTTAFVAGVNAWIDLVEKEPERLPVEFRLLGTRPQKWTPEDVVRCRAHARVRNLDAEVLRSGIVAAFGLDADRFHKKLQPEWRVAVPEGLEPHAIPPAVMKTYLLATEPNVFATGQPAEPLDIGSADSFGSNNWAVAPSRTATGRAILASDPHRVHEQPSLRYVVHLVAPGLDVIGAGEPAIPGVSFGHNDRLAFSLTIHPSDQEDLHVYEIDPADPDRYRYGDGWERMRTVREAIPVRDGDPVTVDLKFTRHGPVLHVDAAAGRAYAVRTVWTEPGTAAYMASLNYIKARDWHDYTAALEGWGAPSANHVVADIDGNIGWAAAAFVPQRPNWDGLMPVPGDGRYEWSGMTRSSGLPRSYNPAEGWVGSANQMNLPPDYDYRTRRTGFEWTDGARYARLSEVLASRAGWTVDETLALQTDFGSVPARRLCALLAPLSPPAGPARDGATLLAGWDHRLDAASGPAALFEIWFMKHIVPTVMRRLAPAGVAAMVTVPDTALIVDLVETADPAFGADPTAARDALLVETLAAAWAEAAALMGEDPAGWSWGRIHRGFFPHPLSRLAPAELKAKLDIGPAPKGGSNLTINNNGYRTTDFQVMSGVTWRMVVDVGNWDASWTINSPGQSGDPASPHYRDLFPLWAKEEYVPMVYSRGAVEAAAERRIRLVPA
ncbi:penicillin amidase [Allostella sp. ATCC 35155]|nr:penicillin amidase [Stella sp. ATCC 35155]